MRPPIGVPRLYEGDIEVLYPGEIARAVTDEDTAARILPQLVRGSGIRAGYLLHQTAIYDDVKASSRLQWIVEPTPGLSGALDRLFYRAVGQWIDRLRDWRKERT